MGPTRTGYLNPKSVLEQLYTAMEEGGRGPKDDGEERKPAVARVEPSGELRTFPLVPAHVPVLVFGESSTRERVEVRCDSCGRWTSLVERGRRRDF